MNEQDSQSIRDLKEKVDEVSRLVEDLLGSQEVRINKTLVYEERRHFENLFKDRISIHLLFSTLLLFAVYSGSDSKSVITFACLGDVPLQRTLLAVGTVISAILSQAVYRTYQFANRSLEQIKSTWPNDPYPTYERSVSLWNANRSLLGASFALTFLFLFLTVFEVR